MGVPTLQIADYAEIEAIKTLRSLYAHHLDAHEFDALAQLFTEDAICDFTPRQPRLWEGRDQIREGYRGVPKPGSPRFSFMHAITNPWIELTGPDSATGRWLLLDLVTEPDTINALMLAGMYNDNYKKIDGAWYIHRTRIDHVWRAQMDTQT